MRFGRWSGLLAATTLTLMLPLGAAAQEEDEDGDAPPAVLPALEGLAWYRSLDLSGSEMPDSLEETEVAAWSVLAEGAGATLDDLSYTLDLAFDPAALPRLGALATVRVEGSDPAERHAAVVQDIVDQAVALGADPPESQPTTLGDKDVTVLVLPEATGFETATVYTNADASYVLLLPSGLVSDALDQLP
jgi:hypothetical protein